MGIFVVGLVGRVGVEPQHVLMWVSRTGWRREVKGRHFLLGRGPDAR